MKIDYNTLDDLSIIKLSKIIATREQYIINLEGKLNYLFTQLNVLKNMVDPDNPDTDFVVEHIDLIKEECEKIGK